MKKQNMIIDTSDEFLKQKKREGNCQVSSSTQEI